MKSASQLSSQFLHQPTQNSQTSAGQSSPSSEQDVVLVNAVFVQLRNTFGRKFNSRFKTEQERVQAKRTWLHHFTREGITAEHVTYAMGQCTEQRLEWPPEINEFLRLCDGYNEAGLPSEQQTFEQIVSRHGRERFNDNFTWLHTIVYYIDQRIGQYVTREPESHFLKRLKPEFKAALNLYKAGELPEPRLAIPPPDLPPPIDQFKDQVTPDQSILNRLNAIRTIKETR